MAKRCVAILLLNLQEGIFSLTLSNILTAAHVGFKDCFYRRRGRIIFIIINIVPILMCEFMSLEAEKIREGPKRVVN